MLKIIFTCLLVANILLFAYTHSDSGERENHEPERITNQFNTDKLQLLTEEELNARLSKKSRPEILIAENVEEPVIKDLPIVKPNKIEMTATKSALLSCMQTGPLKKDVLKKARKWFKQNEYDENISEIKEDIADKFLVYIPASKNKETTLSYVSKLKSAGISEYYMLKSKSELPGSISLGVFSTEAAALAHVERISTKGIKQVQMKPMNSRSLTVFKLKKITDSQVKEINKALADMDSHELQKCSTH